jgi:hypothetical protein
VGLRNRQHLLDSGARVELELCEQLALADCSDDGCVFPGRDASVGAGP